MKKMIFIALVVAALTAVAHADLFSHWTFDEGAGTIAHDSAGSNHGMLFNDPAWTTGKIGGALSFDGTDDFVLLPTFSVSTNDGTIALWFKTSGDFSGNYGHQGYLISGSAAFWSYLTLEGGGNHPYRISGETDTQDDYFVATAANFAGQWNHVAVSFHDKTAKTYLNGGLIDTRSVTDSFLTLDRIGGLSSEFYNGKIDDVRIYDNALSQSEIRALLPEPVTLFLLGLGSLALLRKRRT
jgi:hypothetical protein